MIVRRMGTGRIWAGLWVVALPLLLLSTAPVPTQAAPAAGHGDGGQGLGGYGPSGPITRADLPAGLQDRVSDEALDLAVSSELAEARASWDSEVDFVGQLDYQLRFRPQTDYLSTESALLGTLLSDRPQNVGIELYGLYLTEDEAKELDRRLEVGDRIEDVVAALGGDGASDEGSTPVYGPNFAGVWQDQLDGGAIVVALVDAAKVDRAELARIVGGDRNLRVLDGQYSWDEVEDFSDSLVNQIRKAGLKAEVRINSTSEGRRLEVVTPDPGSIPSSILALVPAEIVSVVEGPVDVPAGNPDTTHSAADQMPGLLFDSDPGSWCTWGMNGHTSSWNYIVTAGHCGDAPYENYAGWTAVYEMHQNNSLLLTSGTRYLYSIKVEDYDVKRMSSGYANDNCYHSNAHCNYSIEKRALHNSWEINSDIVCSTLGSSAVYECGYVTQVNYNSTGCGGDRWIRFSIDNQLGDSGSGVIGPGSQTSIDAMHICTSGTSSIGQTAYHVKTKLLFDFNCATTAVTKAASAWGACPTVNR